MSDTLRYEVVVEGNNSDGYSAFLPSLLGCVSAGDTIEEEKTLIVEAVAFHIEGMVEDGLPIPESVAPSLFVEIAAVQNFPAAARPNPKTIYQSRLVYAGV